MYNKISKNAYMVEGENYKFIKAPASSKGKRSSDY